MFWNSKKIRELECQIMSMRKIIDMQRNSSISSHAFFWDRYEHFSNRISSLEKEVESFKNK